MASEKIVVEQSEQNLRDEFSELNEMQLALVGGGSGEVCPY